MRFPTLPLPARVSTSGNLAGLQAGETVRTMLAVRDLEEERPLRIFRYHNGTVKKTAVKDFSHVMQRGIIAINIEEGDELVAASLTDGNQIVFLASHDGQAIRFDENDVRPMGRNATGVRGMNLSEKKITSSAWPPQSSPRRRRSLPRQRRCRSRSR
jgi:DNA gyrase subunit A